MAWLGWDGTGKNSCSRNMKLCYSNVIRRRWISCQSYQLEASTVGMAQARFSLTFLRLLFIPEVVMIEK
jgi:hypothetical protein